METASRRKTNFIGGYLLAFIIPVIITIIGFALVGIEPFGPHNLMFSDIGNQYIPFLTQLRDNLVHHAFSNYSLSFSLGNNYLPTFAYYAASPFNLLLVFGSAAQVPTMMVLMIILKIGLIGLSTSYMLVQLYHQRRYDLLLFSTAFALSGYVVAYMFNLMWLDNIILIPLIILGLERVIHGTGKWLYTFALAATILTNYYLGYMTALFTIIYFVGATMRDRPEKMAFGPYFKQQLKSVWTYIATSILGVMMSAILLIPTVLGMLKTAKSARDWAQFVPQFRFSTDFFAALSPGAESWNQRMLHAPDVFVGTLTVLLVLGYLFSKQINARRKHWMAAMAVTMFLAMLISTTDIIFHMFTPPAGFPFREAFFLSLLLIMMGYEAWINGVIKEKGVVLKVTLIMLIVLPLAYFTNNQLIYPLAEKYPAQLRLLLVGQLSWLYLIPGMLIIAIAGVLLLVVRRRKWAIGLVALLMFAELGVNFVTHYRHSSLGQTSEQYTKAFKQDRQLTQTSREQLSKSLGRTDFYQSNVNTAGGVKQRFWNNNNVIQNIPGLSMYDSAMNNDMRMMLGADFGLYSPTPRHIGAVGLTPISTFLFGMRYQFSAAKEPALTENDTYRGVGLAVSPAVATAKVAQHGPLTNQNRVAKAVLGTKQNMVTRLSVASVQQSKDKDGIKYVIQTIAPNAGTVYMSYPKEYVHVNGVTVNSKRHRQHWKVKYTAVATPGTGSFAPGYGYQPLIQVKHAEAGEQIRIAFHSDKPIRSIHSGLKEVNDRFTTAIKAKKINHVHWNAHQKDSKLSGTITAPSDQRLLYLAIPYDKGWHATINGQPVATKRIVSDMMGVQLNTGVNHLKLTYTAPGLRLGQLLTVLGLLISLGWMGFSWTHGQKGHKRQH